MDLTSSMSQVASVDLSILVISMLLIFCQKTSFDEVG